MLNAAALCEDAPRISIRMLRFVPIVRPPRPPAEWNVGPARPPRTVWASIITIVGSTCARFIERIKRAIRDIARGPDAVLAPSPPLLPDGLPRRVAIRQVAPLDARPGEEQDRLDHLAARVACGHAGTTRWVE